MYKITRLIGFLILTGIIFFSPTAHASAALVRCRTDPIFVLSNGDVINVTLDIGTGANNIRKITYILHVPAGVTVKRVAYTAINHHLNETYQVHQISPEKTYTTTTVVTTINSYRVEVGSLTRLNGVPAKYVWGYSSQPLTITVNKEESIGWIYRQ
jgi:hypothetical protein